MERTSLSFILSFSPLSHHPFLLNGAPSLLSAYLSSSPGILPPSYLTPLQSHLVHLTPPPPPPPVSLSHHYSGFMSWMSSVSFMHPSTISKVKLNTHKHPPPPLVSSLGWAEGRSRQQSIRAQWQWLCCSDSVQCAVLEATGAEHREVPTGLTHPAHKQYCSFHSWCGWIRWFCVLCQWNDLLLSSMSQVYWHFKIGT